MLKNGSRKELMSNEYQIVHFKNGDIKQILPKNEAIIYVYEEDGITEFNFNDTGLKILKFENNQVEFHHSDGLVEVK